MRMINYSLPWVVCVNSLRQLDKALNNLMRPDLFAWEAGLHLEMFLVTLSTQFMAMEMAIFTEFLLGQFYCMPPRDKVQNTGLLFASVLQSFLQTAVNPLLKIPTAITGFILFILPESLVIVFHIFPQQL